MGLPPSSGWEGGREGGREGGGGEEMHAQDRAHITKAPKDACSIYFKREDESREGGMRQGEEEESERKALKMTRSFQHPF